MWALGVWLKGQISGLIEAARANLTATVNTRATPANVTAAQTALTTTINTRATPANVTAAQTAITNHINTRTVANGQPQAVKSVQRGTMTANANMNTSINIASIDVSKSVLHFSGGNLLASQTNSSTANILPNGQINSATSIVFGARASQSNTGIQWQVIEYF